MPDDHGKIMLSIARSAIEEHLGKIAGEDESAPWLFEPGACFVTLTINGELRGCIGSLEPYQPLIQDLKQNACAAAFRDPRFKPLGKLELDKVLVEVSLLSEVTPITFMNEADLLVQIRPGGDGLILEYRQNRGTFLPQVWEQLPTPTDFLRHLKMKAGLPPDFWSDEFHLSRYTVKKWKEGYPSEITP